MFQVVAINLFTGLCFYGCFCELLFVTSIFKFNFCKQMTACKNTPMTVKRGYVLTLANINSVSPKKCVIAA